VVGYSQSYSGNNDYAEPNNWCVKIQIKNRDIKMTWIYLLQGIGYGLAAASQPGPFQTYIISQTLTRGWKRTLPAAFAPLISDGPIIFVCLLVLSQVPAWWQRSLYIIGGLFSFGLYQLWLGIIHREIQCNSSNIQFKQATLPKLSVDYCREH
jgi:arginine exporter protein ArgO